MTNESGDVDFCNVLYSEGEGGECSTGDTPGAARQGLNVYILTTPDGGPQEMPGWDYSTRYCSKNDKNAVQAADFWAVEAICANRAGVNTAKQVPLSLHNMRERNLYWV